MTDGRLTLTVVTPGKRVVADIPVTQVTLPGLSGEMQVLPMHTELMSVLDTGILSYQENEKSETKQVAISYGYVEVQNNHVLVLADTAETKADIDLARAKAAQQKAESVMREGGVDLSQVKKYDLKLRRAITRQTVAGS